MSQVALVTGGSSGIGRSVARLLARRQVGVVLTYRRQADAARAVVSEIEAGGGAAVALPLDVARVDGLDSFVAKVRELLEAKWGSPALDFLVNNAGVGGGTPFPEITEAGFDAMLGANFKGPFFLTQKLLPLLRDGGHIVNVSSSAARQVSVGFSAYGASKAALTAVTRYWAKELAPRRIRVNSVSPGPVVTNLADGAFAKHPEYIPMLAAQSLVGRVAEPDDVGDVIVALLSDACRHMTAADIDVSGGFMV